MRPLIASTVSAESPASRALSSTAFTVSFWTRSRTFASKSCSSRAAWRHFLQGLCEEKDPLIIEPFPVFPFQKLRFKVIINELAEHLDEKPPLFPLGGARPSLFDKSVHYLPALPEFRSHLVDPLFLASERGAGNGINAHTPQMFEEFVKRQPALGKYPVYLLQNLRRQSAKG